LMQYCAFIFDISKPKEEDALLPWFALICTYLNGEFVSQVTGILPF
jgi:hypothetical protein